MHWNGTGTTNYTGASVSAVVVFRILPNHSNTDALSAQTTKTASIILTTVVPKRESPGGSSNNRLTPNIAPKPIEI